MTTFPDPRYLPYPQKIFPYVHIGTGGKNTYQDVYGKCITTFCKYDGMDGVFDLSQIPTEPPQTKDDNSTRLYDVILWHLLKSNYHIASMLYCELRPNTYELYKVGETITCGLAKNHDAFETKRSFRDFLIDAAFRYGKYEEKATAPDQPNKAHTKVVTKRKQKGKKRELVLIKAENLVMPDDVFLKKLKFIHTVVQKMMAAPDHVQSEVQLTMNDGQLFFDNIFGCTMPISPQWNMTYAERDLERESKSADPKLKVVLDHSRGGGLSRDIRKRKSDTEHGFEPPKKFSTESMKEKHVLGLTSHNDSSYAVSQAKKSVRWNHRSLMKFDTVHLRLPFKRRPQ